VSNERVGFEIETLNKDRFDFSCCMIDDHGVKERSLASSTQHDIFNPPKEMFLTVKLMTLNNHFVGSNPQI